MEETFEGDVEEKLIPKTFFWMFLGLLGTGIIAWITYSTGLLVTIFSDPNYFYGLLIAEIVVVLLFTFLFRKLSATIVGILFFVYAMLNGVTLASIFYIFYLNSIILLFGVSAALFGGLAFIGYKTQKDLSSWKYMLFGTLFAGLVASVINIFLKNTVMDIAIDWVILLVFFGITIYDMNKIRRLAEDDRMDRNKLHIYGAMQLYLDFINIFLRILALFGKRRR